MSTLLKICSLVIVCSFYSLSSQAATNLRPHTQLQECLPGTQRCNCHLVNRDILVCQCCPK